MLYTDNIALRVFDGRELSQIWDEIVDDLANAVPAIIEYLAEYIDRDAS